jgi:membrane-associated phospholipid phosphatase
VPLIALLIVALAAGGLAAGLAGRLLRPGVAGAAVSEELEQLPWLRRHLRRRLDREVATGLALTVALAVVTLGGAVVGLLALLLRTSHALVELDRGAARWGSVHAGHTSTHILRLITDMGDTPAVPVMAVALVAVELTRVRSRWLVPFLLAVMVGNELATVTIKSAVERARPTLNPLAHTLGPSFPSGHSSTAAAFFAAAALILSRRRGRWSRALLAGAAVGLAVAVAASRVLLDLHWVSDVIAGLALGWAWFAACAIAFGGRLLELGVPLEPRQAGRPRAVAQTRRYRASASE